MTEIAHVDPNTGAIAEFRNPPPTRWTTPQGVAITGFDRLTDAQRAAFGWYPVIREPLDEAHEAGAPYLDAGNGRVVVPAIPKDLGALKAQAKIAVNAAAGRARARYITSAPGQEIVYKLKLEQAESCKAAGYPADDGTRYAPGGPYALVGAEMAAQGWTDPRQATDFILTVAAWWEIKAAQIESARRKGLVAIDAAADGPAALAARDAAVTELEGL